MNIIKWLSLTYSYNLPYLQFEDFQYLLETSNVVAKVISTLINHDEKCRDMVPRQD